MITRYHTKSGSIYEVDDTKKVFRRVQGGAHYAGKVDEWTPYNEAVMVWGSLHVQYRSDKPDDAMVTSRVLKIEKIDDAN